MDLIQLKIKKDKNMVKYISLIRKFDNSMSMNEIKNNIENNNFAVEFDLDYYDVVEDINGFDKKELFRKLIQEIIKLGGEITIYHNGRLESLKMLDNWLETIKEIEYETERDIERELEEI